MLAEQLLGAVLGEQICEHTRRARSSAHEQKHESSPNMLGTVLEQKYEPAFNLSSFFQPNKLNYELTDGQIRVEAGSGGAEQAPAKVEDGECEGRNAERHDQEAGVQVEQLLGAFASA